MSPLLPEVAQLQLAVRQPGTRAEFEDVDQSPLVRLVGEESAQGLVADFLRRKNERVVPCSEHCKVIVEAETDTREVSALPVESPVAAVGTIDWLLEVKASLGEIQQGVRDLQKGVKSPPSLASSAVKSIQAVAF